MDEMYFNNFPIHIKIVCEFGFPLRLSVCLLCFNFLKYSLVNMKLIYVIGYHYGIFGTENEVRSTFRSFKGSFKRIIFNYCLWGSVTVF